MATKTSHRVAIWVITIVMAVGSLGAYFLIILANQNDQTDQANLQKQLAQQQQQKTKDPLPGYDVYKFDAASVTDIQSADLKVGDGQEVKAGDTITVNYEGNLPDGTIFDSTASGSTVTPASISLGSVIQGWQKGIPGMKVGGVRRLVIPAAQAYGASGSSDGSIPANTPIAFIVEVTGDQSK